MFCNTAQTWKHVKFLVDDSRNTVDYLLKSILQVFVDC